MLATCSDDDVFHSPELDILSNVFHVNEPVKALEFADAESTQVGTWHFVKWRDFTGGFVEAQVEEYPFDFLSHEQLVASILDETIYLELSPI